MNPFCCPFNDIHGFGHNAGCYRHPHKGKTFLSYPDGVGDVKFTYRDGSTYTVKRVMVDKVGGDPHGHLTDVQGEFENGELFHIPNCVMWEVVFN